MSEAPDPPVNADQAAEAHLRQALELARRLELFSQQPLDNLGAAMRPSSWRAEYRAIVWGLVARKAARLEAEAAAEAEAERLSQ